MDEVLSEGIVKKDNEIGGNIPGGNFLGGNFPEGSLMGGNFPGGSFPDTTANSDVTQRMIIISA